MMMIIGSTQQIGMLKKVERSGHENVASKSAVREFRASLMKWSKFPEQQIELLFPKKGRVNVYKLRCGEDKAEHVVVDKELHFVGAHEYCIPALRTVHAYPDMYPRFTADEGAIKFMLKGANLMAPGLLNEHAKMDEVAAGAVVSVYVYGHEHCVAIGIARMSKQEVLQTKEGIAAEIIHYVGDSFWNMLYRSP